MVVATTGASVAFSSIRTLVSIDSLLFLFSLFLIFFRCGCLLVARWLFAGCFVGCFAGCSISSVSW
nr:MAG TPA: hypothetical protein [Caudoviricetes sp.]